MWFQIGINLEIPYHQLFLIKALYRDVKVCQVAMLQCRLRNISETKWSTIVKALVKAGCKVLAHKIALDHGIYM